MRHSVRPARGLPEPCLSIALRMLLCRFCGALPTAAAAGSGGLSPAVVTLKMMEAFCSGGGTLIGGRRKQLTDSTVCKSLYRRRVVSAPDCGRGPRRLVITCKYYIQYDQTEPDLSRKPINLVTTGDEIRFIIRLLRRGETEYAMQRYSAEIRDAVDVPVRSYSRLIGAFGMLSSEEDAEKAYSIANYRLDNQHADHLHLALMKVYAKYHHIDKLLDLYRRTLKDSNAPNVDVHNVLIKAYGAIGDVSSAEEYVLHDNISSLNTILHVYASHGQLEALYETLDAIDTHDKLCRNNRTFNILLSTVHDDTARAEAVFQEMKAAHLQPDVVSYSTLLKIYSRNDDLRSMKRVYNDMLAANVAPTVGTFNVAIFTLARMGKMAAAEDAMREMERLGILPNNVTYNMLIKLHNDMGEVQMSRNLFEMMIFGRRLVPTVYSYNSMIAGYASEGKVMAAERLFRRMVETGVKPNRITYATMMNAHVVKGKPYGARGYLRKMTKAGFEPDERSMGLMAVAWAKVGKIGGAMAIIREMKRRKMGVSMHGMTAVMKAYVRRKNVAMAEIILEEMGRGGVEPSIVTYNVLLDGYAKMGMRAEAEELVRSMKPEPNVVTYTTLMSVCVADGDYREAQRIFTRLRDVGLEPTDVTFGVLVNCYRKAGMVEKAQAIPAQMRRLGLLPNGIIYGVIIALHADRCDSEMALQTHQKMLSEGIYPTRISLITLIHALLKAKDVKRANKIFLEADMYRIKLPKMLYQSTTMRRG